ncbi:lipin [Thraustotheca clavata]|uniref:phosphatidate phosphatase n=1 Tax=Thraustotheca clavata TaxID=74557 RepID=A0A1V9ZWU1_9STRA|nr:lipin [Thraustotheca clavata]
MNVINSMKGYMINVFEMAAPSSGAGDVVVIQHDGDSMQGTPFAVHFGKIEMGKSNAFHVSLLVNGVTVDHVPMEVQENGQVYFVNDVEALDLEMQLDDSLVHEGLKVLSHENTKCPPSIEKASNLEHRNTSIYFDAIDGTQQSFLNSDFFSIGYNSEEDAIACGGQIPQLSLCRHLLRPLSDANDIIFAQHLVSREHFRANPIEILTHPHLMVSVNGLYHPYDLFVQAYLVTKLCFPMNSPSPRPRRQSDPCPTPATPRRIQRADSDPTDERSCWFQWFNSETSSTDGTASINNSCEKRHLPIASELNAMGLVYGENKLEFVIQPNSKQPPVRLSSVLYLWHASSKLVIVDIDSALNAPVTSSKSFLGFNPTASIPGANTYFKNIADNGYHIIYTTSQADVEAPIPRGPMFRLRSEPLSSLLTSLRALFPSDVNPFYAAFGQPTNMLTFSSNGVPSGKIFAISGGQLYGARRATQSYTELLDVMHAMFPPIYSLAVCKHQTMMQQQTALPSPNTKILATRRTTRTLSEDAFNDINYWRIPPSSI